MSSFLCFICHSTVNAETTDDMREKYREVIGMNLCIDSHLCHICCHVLSKLWMFRAVCLKHSLEYPVLFREIGALNLQRNNLDSLSICTEDACEGDGYRNRDVNSKIYTYTFEDSQLLADEEFPDNDYVKLEEDNHDFDDHFLQQEDIIKNINNTTENKDETSKVYNINSPENLRENNEVPQIESNLQRNEENYNNEDDNAITNDNYDSTIDNNVIYNNDDEVTEAKKELKVKKKKSKKNKKRGFEKLTLSVEQQKMELDRRRREKKYLEAEFKCFNCALGFLFKDTYQAHMMRHEESNGEYRCEICTLRFASSSGLRAHSAGHAERHLCSQCGTSVQPRARNTHARVCWGKDREAACHLCAGMFNDASGLQQHLKRFHQMKSSNRTYACNVCGKICSNQAAVRTHMIKHINRKFDCDTCNAKFSSPYTLAQHKKKHNISSEDLHHCDICNVTYNSRKSLLAHRRNALNHQQTIYECPICSRTCPNQRSLSLHIEAQHSTSKNYSCPQCPAKYSNRKSLVRHMGSHSGRPAPKKVICHLCGAGFKGNNKLNRHLRQVCEKAKLEEEFTNILYGQDCLNDTQ